MPGMEITAKESDVDRILDITAENRPETAGRVIGLYRFINELFR